MALFHLPAGPRDNARYNELKSAEQEYGLFCLEFCAMILERRPDQLEALEVAANHCTELGYYADGLFLDERLLRLRPDDPGVLYNIACSLSLVGRVDDAFAALADAVEKGYRNHAHMARDPDLDRLHGDSRFHDLVSRMKSKGHAP